MFAALRISWVVLLERAELWFQRKGKDVITELHFFHSINTLRARCLQREGKGTSILMPAHAMLTWRVWGCKWYSVSWFLVSKFC